MSEQSEECVFQTECELYSQSLEEHVHSDETEPVSLIDNSQSLPIIDLSPPHLDLTVLEKSSSPEESSNDNGNLKEVELDIISYPESFNQQINLPIGPSKSLNDATSLYETSNEDLSQPHLYLTVFEKSSAPEESSNDNGNLKEVELDIISYPESWNQPINLPMGPSKSSNDATSLYDTSNEDLLPPHLDLTVLEKSSSPEESSNDNGNHKEVELDIISYPGSWNQPINLPIGPSKSSNDATSLYETSGEDISEKPSPLSLMRFDIPEISPVKRSFDDLLKNRYPDFEERCEVPLIDLLEWELWPECIRRYADHSKNIKDAEQDRWFIYICAVSQFEDTCKKILSGRITIDELNEIKPRERQMFNLCMAVAAITSSKEDTPPFEVLQTKLNTRMEEFQYFDIFKMQLQHFTALMETVCVKDLPGIQCLLQKDYSGDPINTLCTITPEGTYQIKCFNSAEALFPYVETFFVFSRKYANGFFESFWLEMLSQVERNNEVLTFRDVIDLVWKPVLDQCIQLLNNLRTWKMKLCDIDEVLKRTYSDQKSLTGDLENLSRAVSECCDGVKDLKWIKEVSDRMWQYWELCSYREPAKAFLKIRDSLDLSGDFDLIEIAAKQFVEDQTLESIDENVVEACDFLKPYAANMRKRECLEAFAECQGIVERIRSVRDDQNKTEDVSDLQQLVKIALGTVGSESECNTDKLSYLRTVGSGFGLLIYKLPKDADYVLLHEHCKELWETLEQTGIIPEIMRACENEVPYQSIHETQEFVENTSSSEISELEFYDNGSILPEGIKMYGVDCDTDKCSSKEQITIMPPPIKNVGEAQNQQLTQTEFLEMKQELVTGIQELKEMFQLVSGGYQKSLRELDEQHLQQIEESNEQLQKQLEESNEQHQQQLQEQLKESNEQHQQQFQELHMLIEGVRQDNQQLHELTRRNVEMENTIQQQDEELHDLRAQIENLQWVIEIEEIEVTGEVIGRGGWGEVKVGLFRGTRVAVKCLHDLILSDYNISLFSREMDIASRVRHPNLLQFIGATKVDNPMILTELMPTSLRKEMDKKHLTHPQILSISRDIVSALNYLHLWRPEPILHRDVASPNVLLEPSGNNQWKGKLSDYGSANLQHQISTTVGPGNPAYAAPESRYPNDHSPAMDVYSFGVLLMEMVVHRPPPPTTRAKEGLIRSIQWNPIKTIIRSCTQEDKDLRPKTSNVLERLHHL